MHVYIPVRITPFVPSFINLRVFRIQCTDLLLFSLIKSTIYCICNHYLCNKVSNEMHGKCPSDANSRSAGQENTRGLWNPKDHLRADRSKIS
jgi:hypothetical protein